MKKSLFAIAIILILVFILGCTQLPVCGNGVCELNENSGTCPSDCSSGIPESQARATWKSAEPFGIIDWSINKELSNTVTLVLRNNTSQTLELAYFAIGSMQDSSVNGLIASGATKTIDISYPTICHEENSYLIPKEDISINYHTDNIQYKQQKGIADILGTC